MANNSIATIKGFADLFEDASTEFTAMESAARTIFKRFAYEELRTPILEKTELFQKSIGSETDVVQKEMYTFPDRKNRSLSLRPEATAGVIRAYLNSGKYGSESISRFFTFGPMFRYERPQKGRMRQFHQINCESLGSDSPYADAEIIAMLMHFLQHLGIIKIKLFLNSLGCKECRPNYHETLANYLQSLNSANLCPDCKRRIETNPLRVLDCKIPECKELTCNAPTLLESNCPECKSHFNSVTSHLDALNIPWTIDNRLVRGLDYYCRTTFEVVSSEIGAQASIAGGGRYDGLVQSLGGPNVPGIGFACGMERLAMLLPKAEKIRPDFFMLVCSEGCRDKAFSLCHNLRILDFSGDMVHKIQSFKKQLSLANKSSAKFALLCGLNECTEQNIIIKNLDSGEQNTVDYADVINYLQNP